jgi:tellurite resistance protein
MFRNIFGHSDDPASQQAAQQAEAALNTAADQAAADGDTATVRRIVAKLESMPPDQARLVASAAYTLARVANADLDISDDETAAIEQALQGTGSIDEATSVLVTEMAKFQAKTVGGTEDYVVTREFRKLASDDQRKRVIHAAFAIGAANGVISAEESTEINQVARELDIEPAELNAIRAEFHDQLSSVQEIRRVTNAEG